MVFALCTHFIEIKIDRGIFGSLFFVPLAFAAWNWGVKRALVLAAYGAVLNFVVIVVDLAVLKHVPFGATEAVFGFALGISLYLTVGFIVGSYSDANHALHRTLNEAKVLRGFIPICAKCKQIRDDQGFWRHIEEYLKEHSEAEFSQSLCPKCAHETREDPAAESEKPAVRESGSPRQPRLEGGRKRGLIPPSNFVVLAIYTAAYALCTHFIDSSGIFGSLFFIPAVICGWVCGVRNVPALAAAGVVLNNAVLTIEYLLIRHEPFVFSDMALGSLFGFALYAIVGFVAGRMGDNNRALKKALNEVKVLRGLIPICVKCKQIRDDQGFWRHIEEYLKEHSEAVFSHGLCPKCAHELYGDALPTSECGEGTAR